MNIYDAKYIVSAKREFAGTTIYANKLGMFGEEGGLTIERYFTEPTEMTYSEAIAIINALNEKRKNNITLWIYDWKLLRVVNPV